MGLLALPDAEVQEQDEAMTQVRSFLATVLALTLGALVLGACGGSTTPTANKKDARTALLISSDVPSGWTKTSAAPPSNAELEKQAANIASCSEFLAQVSADKKALKIDSPTFQAAANSNGQQTSISNEVVGYSSEENAKASYATYSSSNTLTCLKRIFTSLKNQVVQESSGALSVKLNVATADVPKVGNASMAYGVEMDIADQVLLFVIEFVRLGPYVISFSSTVYPPAPNYFGRTAVTRSIGRLEKASGISGAAGT